MDHIPPPVVLLEESSETAVRAWRSWYYFDTTDGGRLEALPEFFFELMELDQNSYEYRHRSNNRRYRLFKNGSPSLGGQYYNDIESAHRRAKYIVEAYASNRVAHILSTTQSIKFNLYHKLRL